MIFFQLLFLDELQYKENSFSFSLETQNFVYTVMEDKTFTIK